MTSPAGKIGPSARSILAAIHDFAQRATTLLAAPAVLRKSAMQQTAILNAQQVRVRLSERPIGELRGIAGKGARIGQLENAGYTTVADVLTAPDYRLLAVQGVGAHSAEQAKLAAQRVADRVASETKLKLDPDRQAPAQTQLLATLAAARHADAAASVVRQPLKQFTAQVTPLVAEAERTGSKLKMAFSGPAKKRSALAALSQLEAILADARVVSLMQTVASAEQAVDPRSYAPRQLWRDYASDAASFNALLSTVGGAGETDDKDAAAGYISPELRQKITAIPLDTSLLRATLRGYQVFGAQYAIHQQRSIIGDEMGLGKTIQALAVFTHMAAKGQTRFMVVCPASVQINWLKEIEKHTQLAAYSLHGSQREATGRRWLRTGGVAVTTFTTLGSLNCIEGVEVAMTVVDEAHYVKNPDARRSKNVRRMLNQSQRALFLTGTPMENRVEEFRNLVDYVQPHVAARVDPTDAVAGAKAFRRAVAPAYLRRNQEDVLTELPEKIEVEEWVQLTPDDDHAYRSAVTSRNLMQMRQAAYNSRNSAKLERLRELVDEAMDDGHKVIVFSYFLGVLDTIRRALGPVAMGPLTGSVPPTARQQLVDDFTRHEGPAVLLSQIEAGGVGLNVQAASIVIIAEPQWKPSTEQQAIARAHRMGQIRMVQVHRLLAKGSVDERLREIQERKSLLFDEFARKSDAKDADPRAVDATHHRPAMLDDESIPLKQRIVLAEEIRLGMPPR